MQGRPEDSRAPIQLLIAGPLWAEYADARALRADPDPARGSGFCPWPGPVGLAADPTRISGFSPLYFSSDTPNFKFCNIEKILEVLVQMIIFSKRKRNVFEGVKVSKSDFHFFQLWKKNSYRYTLSYPMFCFTNCAT